MVKTRVDRFHDNKWWEWSGLPDSTPMPIPPNYHRSFASQDLIYSEGHSLRGLGEYDVGGNFHVLRREHEHALYGPVHNRTTTNENSSAYNYKGYYYAFGTSVEDDNFPYITITSDATLDALGSTAIARVLPTNPLTGLTTTLAEIKREGIPSLIGAESLRQRALRARNAGSEYLNVEFGWRPLVSEVLSLADAIIDSDELMKKYERESGKLLHRSYTFQDVVQTTSSSTSGLRAIPTIKLAYSTPTGIQHVVTTTRWRRSFDGVFTYHLAPQGSLARKEQLAAKRFGTRITPETLWTLTPWSWAADWVTNIGDVMHNVSAFAADGLVMPWGYVMHEKSITTEYTFSGSRLTRTGEEVRARQKLTATRKQRRKATPFGFGLNPTTFSGRQWAILAALGLARGPGQMSK